MNRKKLLHAGLTLLAVFFILLIFYHCPFSYVFGLSCPGCGMTRALFALLRLDFSAAFYYHPLFPLVLVLALGYAANYLKWISFSKRFCRVVLIVTCAAFILTYIIRLAAGHPVVAWDFQDSLIYRVVHFIFAR